jgi:antitoxin (DNA-binding transcriptional repressor) of toxin-antitoxin stability system
MMKIVTIRDSRNRFSEVEARLQRGEEVEVRRRQRPNAKLAPLRPTVEYLDFGRCAEGNLRPPQAQDGRRRRAGGVESGEPRMLWIFDFGLKRRASTGGFFNPKSKMNSGAQPTYVAMQHNVLI